MKKVFTYLFLLTILFAGCKKDPAFCIKGTITGAKGETLYLEHTTLTKTTIVDSCVLNAKGKFSLEAPAPAYSDFYRLRIGSSSLLLAIDSTETITISSSRENLPYTTNIKGSQTSLEIAKLRESARSTSREELREIAQKLIVSNPRSLAAYFAIYLKVNGEFIWDLSNASDRRMYQAVATSFETWMPEYERTKALCNQVREALNKARSERQQEAVKQLIESSENAFLDISLTDNKGKEKSLAELRGKVIVLDFSAIEMEQSKGYIFELRALYNQYHKHGMEIYSVSLDRSRLIWEDGVVNLPWVNVFAGDKAVEVLTRYNVQSLPTLFLLDRKGNVQGRYTDFDKLEADIRKYL